MNLSDFTDTLCFQCVHFTIYGVDDMKSPDGKVCLTWKCKVDSSSQKNALMPLPWDYDVERCSDYEWEGEF